MAQEELAHPVAPRRDRVSVVAGPAQVSHRLVRLRGRVDLGEKTRAQQLGELARVPAVRLDSLARLARTSDGATTMHDTPRARIVRWTA